MSYVGVVAGVMLGDACRSVASHPSGSPTSVVVKLVRGQRFVVKHKACFGAGGVAFQQVFNSPDLG